MNTVLCEDSPHRVEGQGGLWDLVRREEGEEGRGKGEGEWGGQMRELENTATNTRVGQKSTNESYLPNSPYCSC